MLDSQILQLRADEQSLYFLSAWLCQTNQASEAMATISSKANLPWQHHYFSDILLYSAAWEKCRCAESNSTQHVPLTFSATSPIRRLREPSPLPLTHLVHNTRNKFPCIRYSTDPFKLASPIPSVWHDRLKRKGFACDIVTLP